MPLSGLNQKELQRLIEISKIGMGHAATALSQLTGKRVRIEVPRLLVLDGPSCITVSHKDQTVGLNLQIFGEIRGGILIVLPAEQARHMLQGLLGTAPAASQGFTELEHSALLEVGNILASAYLNALGSALGMALLPSVPSLSLLPTRKSLDQVLGLSREKGAKHLIETIFSIDEVPGSGCLFLIPANSSLPALLQAMGPN